MNPIVVLWSLAAGASLTLGLVHALVWLFDRTARVNLVFALVAASFAGMAAVELGLMGAATPEEYGAWIRWAQVPIFVSQAGLVLFIRIYFGTSTHWLGWSVIGLRAFIVAITLLLGLNFNFDAIESLDRVSFLGESVSTVGEATVGRWQWVASTATVLQLVYALDATIRLWRQGGRDVRRKFWVIGVTTVGLQVLASGPSQMVIWGAAHIPVLVSPGYFVLVLAMGAELSREVLNATRLARDLRDRDDQLELAANAAGLGIWTWNAATRSMRATDRARSLLGIEKNGSMDVDTWCAAIHPDDVTAVRAGLEQALASGEEFAAEFRLRPSNKDVRWIGARGQLDTDKNGAPTVLRGIVRDITAAKRSVDEVRELRRDLTHAGRVTLLGQLSAALAHELNQPLGAILRNTEAAELLLRRPDPDLAEIGEILGDIRSDDRRAANVIDHLRALLRRGNLDMQPLQVENMIRDVVALVRGDAAGKHVGLDFAAQPLPPALGDRVHLSQVLLNLIVNGMDAVQEAKPANPRVSIDAKCSDGMIEVAVSDSGNGIAPGTLDRLFDPFYTTKAHGMGMGLPVSRTIVEAHGGKIWAESNGSGATFRFTVPAAR